MGRFLGFRPKKRLVRKLVNRSDESQKMNHKSAAFESGQVNDRVNCYWSHMIHKLGHNCEILVTISRYLGRNYVILSRHYEISRS